MKYFDYNDQQLLELVNEANEDALEIIYKKYEPLIHTLAKRFYPHCKNAGLELNDLEQEGRIGLSNAIAHYKENKDVLFYTFAKTCIERKLISMMIATKRLKHKILNESISFDFIDSSGKETNLENIVLDDTKNPESVVFSSEHNRVLMEQIRLQLTDLELQVFELKYHNFNYREIAKLLDKSPKTIDNALQRIKCKVKKIMEENKE